MRCKEVLEVLQGVALDSKVGDEGDLVLNT